MADPSNENVLPAGLRSSFFQFRYTALEIHLFGITEPPWCCG